MLIRAFSAQSLFYFHPGWRREKRALPWAREQASSLQNTKLTYVDISALTSLALNTKSFSESAGEGSTSFHRNIILVFNFQTSNTKLPN